METKRLSIQWERGRKGILRTHHKLNSPGLVSHITQHAAGRDPLFIQQDDYLLMMALLKACAEKYQIRILAFCLMTNHLHLLLQQEQENLPLAMKSLFQTYAGRFNRRYHRSGHLFKSSYRQLACFDNAYIISNSIYIHLNPVRAGMVSKYQDYPWSSWNLYCDPLAPPAFVDPSCILCMLGDKIHIQTNEYQRLLKQALKSALPGNFPEVSRGFALRLWRDRGLGKFHIRPGFNMFPSDEKLQKVLGEVYLSGGFKRIKSCSAKLFIIEQLEARGYRLEDISNILEVSARTIWRFKNDTQSQKK